MGTCSFLRLKRAFLLFSALFAPLSPPLPTLSRCCVVALSPAVSECRPQVSELLGHRSPARSRTAFATRPSRSSCWPLTASAPARQIPPVKQTPRTRCGYRGYAFLCNLPYPQVCMHEVHGWELESGRAGGLGANSSWYGGSSTYQRASSSCVLLALRPKTTPVLQLEGHVIPRCARARASEAGRPEVRDAVWGHLNVVESEQWATRRATERAS